MPLDSHFIFELHFKNPIHCIIDTAPLVLGFAFGLAGDRAEKLRAINDKLGEDLTQTTQKTHSVKEELAQKLEELQTVQQTLEHQKDQIKEQKNTISKIFAYNEAITATIDNSNIVSISDLKGQIIKVNAIFCQISGYSTEELIGQDHRIVNSGYHPKSFWIDMWKTIGKGKVWRAEVCNRSKNGEFYWVDTVINPIYDEKGKIYQYLSIRNLITERKNAELIIQQQNEELRATEEELSQNLEELQVLQQTLQQQKDEIERHNIYNKAILDNAAVMIITTTTEGIITSFNHTDETMLGYTAQELVNQHSPAIFHDIPQIVSRAKKLSQEFGQKVEVGFDVFVYKTLKGLPNKDEWTYISKDGRHFLVSLSITAIWQNEKVIGYIGIAEDISEKKAAEKLIRQQNEELLASQEELSQNLEELRTIQELLSQSNQNLEAQFLAINSTFGYMELDKNKQIIEINALLATWLGYTRTELIGKSHIDLVPKQKQNAVYHTFWEKLFEGQQPEPSINERKTKDGKSIWLYGSYCPVKDHEGNVVKIIKLVTDYTATKQNQDRMQSQSRALQLNQEELKESLAKLTVLRQESETAKDNAQKLLKNITDSINYAKRIQDAIIPSEKELQKMIPNSFVFFRPKDIVSGDFYWLANKGKKQIVVVGDCTGHGVSGAFMTMIANNIIDHIVHNHEIHDADQILNIIPIMLEKVLFSTKNKINDSLDISIVTITTSQNQKSICYAGAMNPIYYVQNQEFFEIKADKMPIGRYHKTGEDFEYKDHEILISSPTMLYMFSDGYQDQFGGQDNRKFMTKNFRKLLHQVSERPLPEQKQILEQTFYEWKGDYPQTDDVLVLGIKIW